MFFSNASAERIETDIFVAIDKPDGSSFAELMRFPEEILSSVWAWRFRDNLKLSATTLAATMLLPTIIRD